MTSANRNILAKLINVSWLPCCTPKPEPRYWPRLKLPLSGNPKIFLNKRLSPRLGHRHGLKLQGNSAHFCLDGPRQTAGYLMFHVEHEAQCNLGHNSAPLKGNVGDVLLLKAGAATRRETRRCRIFSRLTPSILFTGRILYTTPCLQPLAGDLIIMALESVPFSSPFHFSWHPSTFPPPHRTTCRPIHHCCPVSNYSWNNTGMRIDLESSS